MYYNPKVLIIIPYEFYPPINGGSLRCYYLLCALAEKYDVYLITVQRKEDFFTKASFSFPPNVKIISIDSKFHSFFNLFGNKIADAINTRLLRKSLQVKANDFFLKAYPKIRQIIKEVEFKAVIYENLEAFSFFSSIIRKSNNKIVHILDAHNVDSDLWLQHSISENSILMKKYSREALKIESVLFKNTDMIFTCSNVDQQKFIKLNRGILNTVIVPNGVDVEQKIFDSSENKFHNQQIIFCGSLSTYPNKQGILWFYNSVFPELKKIRPDIKLTIIGQLEDEAPFLSLKSDPSVNFIGSVKTVQPYYINSSVAIVPLLSGSGTRLKILEAMSLGNPIVSTSIGAEGIEFENGKELFIADDPLSFVYSINKLLSDKETFDRMRYNALKLVKDKYDWRVIGKNANIAISKLISN